MRRISSMRISPAVVKAVATLLFLGFAVVASASEGGGGAHGGGHGGAAQMKDFMWRCIDFAALVLILAWAIKKADMKKSLADRRLGIEKALKEAEEAKAAAERKFAEYNTKLAQANKDIEELQANIRREGVAEKERIIAEAKAGAAKISEQARVAADQEVLKARAELRREAAHLAVQLAEGTLKEKIEKNDQDRLVGEYLTKVVNLK
jgi:F-type H+-transporting ATPase subunit b